MGIQRRFLWDKYDDNKKIAWVKWENNCQWKKLGVLGVKDILLFNTALLGKWLFFGEYVVERFEKDVCGIH